MEHPQARGRFIVSKTRPDNSRTRTHSSDRVQAASSYDGLWNYALILSEAPGLREKDDVWWSPDEVGVEHALDAL